MYGYGSLYNEVDYDVLKNHILALVSKKLPLRFFLPGFPAKSSNKKHKVFGDMPDFAEFLAIRTLVITARKLQAVYKQGVKITILSDYHTFDQYVGVSEEAYRKYHESMQQMIEDHGAGDVIELMSLSKFPEFKNVPAKELSTTLFRAYGGDEFALHFDENIEKEPALLGKYIQLKKFMLMDLETCLPGAKNSKATKCFIKNVARGMMAQGAALDCFLQSQTTIENYIRLSIHHHHPQTGKLAIDLFKSHSTFCDVLRTPWHHVVLFDTTDGKFSIGHKAEVETSIGKNQVLARVKFNGNDWMYIKLEIAEEYLEYFRQKTDAPFEISMRRGGCGMMVVNMVLDGDGEALSSDCIKSVCLTSLLKEFGLLVLRGFKEFSSEEDIIQAYRKRVPNGLFEWQYGVIHKIKSNQHSEDITKSYESMPIHFDMMFLPKFTGVDQAIHNYEDFICREFLLYCVRSCGNGSGGQTTIIDANAVALAVDGEKIEQWRNTIMAYETFSTQSKEQYIGGRGLVYKYPLIIKCPWTNKNVLRWHERWTLDEHPTSRQVIKSEISSAHEECFVKNSLQLEEEIRKLAFDERFFFGHSYERGDQVYVNNYTTLHGRNGLSKEREIWRIQATPPSDNLPPYLVEHSR